jgi:hypothetical protein
MYLSNAQHQTLTDMLVGNVFSKFSKGKVLEKLL